MEINPQELPTPFFKYPIRNSPPTTIYSLIEKNVLLPFTNYINNNDGPLCLDEILKLRLQNTSYTLDYFMQKPLIKFYIDSVNSSSSNQEQKTKYRTLFIHAIIRSISYKDYPYLNLFVKGVNKAYPELKKLDLCYFRHILEGTGI